MEENISERHYWVLIIHPSAPQKLVFIRQAGQGHEGAPCQATCHTTSMTAILNLKVG